jgi:hypothetical protein
MTPRQRRTQDPPDEMPGERASNGPPAAPAFRRERARRRSSPARPHWTNGGSVPSGHPHRRFEDALFPSMSGSEPTPAYVPRRGATRGRDRGEVRRRHPTIRASAGGACTDACNRMRKRACGRPLRVTCDLATPEGAAEGRPGRRAPRRHPASLPRSARGTARPTRVLGAVLGRAARGIAQGS